MNLRLNMTVNEMGYVFAGIWLLHETIGRPVLPGVCTLRKHVNHVGITSVYKILFGFVVFT